MSLTATADSATLDLAAAVGDAPDTAIDPTLLEGLPAGAWLAAAAPDLGPLLQHALDQLSDSGLPGASTIARRIRAQAGIDLETDVTPWLGGAAGFLRGIAVPGFAAGVVAETSDPEGPRKLVERAQALAERDSGLRSAAPPEGADYGFSLGIPGVGTGAEVGVVGDRLVGALAISLDQVLEPEDTLAEDPRFRAAVAPLGDDFPPAFFLSMPEAFQVAQLGADAGSPDYSTARPYVDSLESLAAGGRLEDGVLFSRLTLTLAE